VRLAKRDIAFQPDPELIRSLRPRVVRQIYSYDTPATLTAMASIPPRPEYLGMDYTNDVGFRMRHDVMPLLGTGARFVLMLGDSYTEAEGVPDEQRFYQLVDRALRERAVGDGRWRLLNAGIQNGAPSQYLLQLRHYLPRFGPEIVLVMLAPNDLADDSGFERTFGFDVDEAGIPVRPKAGFRLWVLQKFWTLRYLDVLLVRRFPALHDAIFVENPKAPVVDWPRLLCQDDAEARSAFRAKTGRYLRRLRDLAASRGAELAVFMIHYPWVFPNEPFYEPAYPTLKGDLASWGCGGASVERYNAFVEGYLREAKIRYRNPYDALMRAKTVEPRTKLWNFYDYHFSPAGHRLVAAELSAFVQEIIRGRPR
jgi:GDSL-like lipase/acylhydrolase family protein